MLQELSGLMSAVFSEGNLQCRN